MLTVLRRCSAAMARANAMRSKRKTRAMTILEAIGSGGDLGTLDLSGDGERRRSDSRRGA